MKKKTVSLLLALIMAVGLCAGCGSEKEPAKAETEASAETKQEAEVKEEEKEEAKQEEVKEEAVAERLPLVKDGEEATLTIGLLQNTSVSDYETNAFTLWVEEQTGINLEFSYFNSAIADAATQLSLMISSGEKLPDILWGFRGLDAAAINEYGRDGYFLDLTDYYANHAYYINEALDQLPETEQTRYFESKKDPVSGGYYGVPLYLAPASDDYQSLQSINKDWLDAVGMEVPTTVDELYDVLVAFRDKDPKAAVAWIFADTMNILEKLGFDLGNGSMRQLTEPAEERFGEEYAGQLNEMITLNDRAMFSSRPLEEPHRESLLNFRNTTIENINKQEKWYKRLWLKWVRCLY